MFNGGMTELLVPQHNLAEVHEAIAARVPDRDCIVFRDRRLSYADVTRRTRQLAHVLHEHGLGARPDGRAGLGGHESHQDHLAIYCHNGNEYLEAMLGAFKARVAPVNVNHRYVAEELCHVLADSGAKAVMVHSRFAATLAEVLPDLPRLELVLQVADESGHDLLPGAQWYEDALAGASDDRPAWADDWSPDDLYILYTGGTTGLPKGVLWRQADIHRTSMGGRDPATRQPFLTVDAAADAAATGRQVVCPAAPFMHGAGHWVAFMGMNQGGTVVVQDVVDRLDPADLCSVIERERVQFLQIVGDAFGRPIVEEMATGRHDVSSVAIVLSGGAALSAPVKARFLDLLPDAMLIDGLGSSEGGGQGMQVTVRDMTASTGTFTPTEGSIVVSEDLTEVLAPGHDGIGWLAKAGGDVPLGYLGDPDKTARTFPVIAGQRMSVPGDRARHREDGSIELLGRDSVTINSGGEKIFAEEVEAAVVAHPDVDDVVVTSRPSERWGQEVVAVVQLRPGADVGEEDLAAEAARHIARYKLPKAWVVVETIERSPAGKADYRWAASTAAGH
jgi:3-oxocholest-4-en-26-oate---CoA ligase